jgi:hypothetical protein
MALNLDHSVYPDIEPPADLVTPEEKADYLQRLCGAFDFGIAPEPYTLGLLSRWKDVFDRFPLKASPAYHALRAFFGWEPVEQLPYLGTPCYLKLDRLEERGDGFEDRV